ncbi:MULTISPECIES: hypothetical protein [unclassified Streptomyces]|uniref:hypothetical protein n=1 Tax=Streptomyces sp. SID4936 TaxID=2690279 RepID=UPI001F1CC89A|nr:MULTISPECIES: hypothetical protein [unclassified Streptomyces]
MWTPTPSRISSTAPHAGRPEAKPIRASPARKAQPARRQARAAEALLSTSRLALT